MIENHFTKRALERGITETDVHRLASELEYAHKNKRDDFLERVLGGDGNISLFRFRVVEGIFYAAMSDTSRAVTVYTQKMMRSKKWARKQKTSNSHRQKRNLA